MTENNRLDKVIEEIRMVSEQNERERQKRIADCKTCIFNDVDSPSQCYDCHNSSNRVEKGYNGNILEICIDGEWEEYSGNNEFRVRNLITGEIIYKDKVKECSNCAYRDAYDCDGEPYPCRGCYSSSCWEKREE